MIRKHFFALVILPVAVTITSFTFIFPYHEAGRQAGQPKQSLSERESMARWTLNKARSHVKFTVTHMVVSETEGSFKRFDGSMECTKADFSDAVIQFTIDVNSIDTENENRDRHLKGDDFFNAKKFPRIRFVSTAFTPAGGNRYTLTGNLTIRDVTKPVTFEVTYGGSTEAKSSVNAVFTAKTTLNRFDYGLKWDKATEAGSLVVSKEVNITVNIELKKV